jgi:hypothetical protein
LEAEAMLFQTLTLPRKISASTASATLVERSFYFTTTLFKHHHKYQIEIDLSACSGHTGLEKASISSLKNGDSLSLQRRAFSQISV